MQRQGPLEKEISADRFCCAGCERVFHYLDSEGLTGYYDVLASLDVHAPSQSIQDTDANTNAAAVPDAALFRSEGQADEHVFFVPGLSCAACLWLVQKALGAHQPGLSAIKTVRVNLEDKLIVVTTKALEPAPIGAILSQLMRLGYKAYPPRLGQSDAFRSQLSRRRLVDIGISGATFGNVMLFATAVYFGNAWDMTQSMARYFNLISFGLASLSLATAGRSFFVTAWKTLRAGMLHIDLPIAAALALAYLVSIVSLVRGTDAIYFDSITGLIFLLLVGRHLNESLQTRAHRLAGAAMSLVPASGLNLQPGDETTVRVGDLIPADGVVTFGSSEVSEAALTGEQTPKVKKLGDSVYAGTHNLVGSLRIRVTQSGDDCYVARIAKLVQEASHNKSTFEALAQRYLTWFVAGIFVVAALAAVIWSQVDPSRIVEVVCATLIVSCPCALALATPLTMATAMRRSWDHGAIVKSSIAIERLALIDAIVLDKTGTMTTGQIKVTHCTSKSLSETERLCLRAAAGLSRHPVSKAINHYLTALEPAARPDQRVQVTSAVEIPGLGARVTGLIDNNQFSTVIGSLNFLKSEAGEAGARQLDRLAQTQFSAAESKAAAMVRVGNPNEPRTVKEILVVFGLQDLVFDDTPRLIRSWVSSGIDVFVVSGDEHAVTSRVTELCGIASDHVTHSASPADKAAFVAHLSQQGRQVLMIGDGVNDAAALASAAVGVAVSGGVDLALSAADVFLASPGLAPVDHLLKFARYTMRSLRMIIAVSVFYNVVAVTLAISGILHPFVAAAIMPAASLSVILIGTFRRGESLWKPYSSSCLLPSPLRAEHS